MIFAFSAALALTVQLQSGAAKTSTAAVRDSVSPATASTAKDRDKGIRRAVTENDRRSAYKDDAARTTILRARVARMTMDSSLVAYDAMSYSRMSAGMSLTRIGRDRLVFRHETAARVRWREGVGVWMEERGQRTGTPFDSKEARADMRKDMRNDPDMRAPIPYFPGYEPLWIGNGVARAQVDEKDTVNPIADGAEAYYTYETGDSARFTLPGGTIIPLREIKVRPRKPQWNLAVGSLWFDTNSGQLVRAAYRLSVPMDIWQMVAVQDSSNSDVPGWVKPMLTPMKIEVKAIAVEYGLHDGRFWLPRTRLAEGKAHVSIMRLPFKLEERFTYASVNGADSLPSIAVDSSAIRAPMPDSLTKAQQRQWRDSVRVASTARDKAADTVRASQCATGSTNVATTFGFDSKLKIAIRSPCDLTTLENSPDLPHSLYEQGEDVFGSASMDALKAEALGMSAQAPLSLRLAMLPPPTLAFGLPMTRYNRVEGLSLGASVEQQVGGGYSGLALARFGFADRSPNVELTVTRSNLARWINASAYTRLVSLSDWGHPLSFGSSFSALMFGRDEGFYYRAAGAELSGSSLSTIGGGARLEWRAFVERQRTADVKARFRVSGADFAPNVLAQRSTFAGVGGRVYHNYGLDPRGLRTMTDLRVEAARGDSLYGRAALDFTVSRALGPMAGAITLAGGSSIGDIPAQRRWYLGGSQTIRGQSPDTSQSGSAFWMTRAELGTAFSGARPAVFADLGWVGDRAKMGQVGRPMSGVGTGVSFMDGLFRFDVARGIYPRKQTRVDLYLESKF